MYVHDTDIGMSWGLDWPALNTMVARKLGWVNHLLLTQLVLQAWPISLSPLNERKWEWHVYWFGALPELSKL